MLLPFIFMCLCVRVQNLGTIKVLVLLSLSNKSKSQVLLTIKEGIEGGVFSLDCCGGRLNADRRYGSLDDDRDLA